MTAIGRDAAGNVVSSLRPGRTERVAVGASSASMGTAPGGTTTHLRISANVDIHYKLGSSPTAAATTSPYLAAGAVEYVPIKDGETLAVIQTDTGGFCWVSECS